MNSNNERFVHPNNTACAVVVTYFPGEGFIDLLRQLERQIDRMVVVDNTPATSGLMDLRLVIQSFPSVTLIENRSNKGIATALNQGLELAENEGYDWLLTLDQDTQCSPDMVTTLLELSQQCQLKPMVIGSNYFDPQSGRTKVPVVGDGNSYLEQWTVITSGSLIDVQMALSIGGFREDYFIDQVDHEFCLRARAHGHTVAMCRKPVMTHSVGRPGGVRLPFLGILPNHPPVRKYYIARNTVVTVATYWRTEPSWCFRRAVRLFLGLIEMAILEQHRVAKIYAFSFGVADALRKRMGPCLRELPQMSSKA